MILSGAWRSPTSCEPTTETGFPQHPSTQSGTRTARTQAGRKLTSRRRPGRWRRRRPRHQTRRVGGPSAGRCGRWMPLPRPRPSSPSGTGRVRVARHPRLLAGRLPCGEGEKKWSEEREEVAGYPCLGRRTGSRPPVPPQQGRPPTPPGGLAPGRRVVVASGGASFHIF